jgi:hypothetical protein
MIRKNIAACTLKTKKLRQKKNLKFIKNDAQKYVKTICKI